MRLLEARGIAFETFTYDTAIRSADGVAAAVNVSIGEVFKTLVMECDDHKLILAMVPGDREVDLRAFARRIGVKSVRMVSKLVAEQRTGLQTGGIGALALTDKPFEVYLDSSAAGRDRILVNGGRRGINLRLGVADLIELTGARVVAGITESQRAP